jgi:bacterioferritin
MMRTHVGATAGTASGFLDRWIVLCSPSDPAPGRGKTGESGVNDNVRQQVVDLLNRILEEELAGVVRYTHYSLLVFGYSRIPIVSWLRDQANESLLHAQQAGEMITMLGAYPSLGIGPLLDSHQHDIGAIMRESLESEARALTLYRQLFTTVEGHSVALEEYARQMIYAEELHASEVDKMMRKPGDLAVASPAILNPG